MRLVVRLVLFSLAALLWAAPSARAAEEVGRGAAPPAAAGARPAAGLFAAAVNESAGRWNATSTARPARGGGPVEWCPAQPPRASVARGAHRCDPLQPDLINPIAQRSADPRGHVPGLWGANRLAPPGRAVLQIPLLN